MITTVVHSDLIFSTALKSAYGLFGAISRGKSVQIKPLLSDHLIALTGLLNEGTEKKEKNGEKQG